MNHPHRRSSTSSSYRANRYQIVRFLAVAILIVFIGSTFVMHFYIDASLNRTHMYNSMLRANDMKMNYDDSKKRRRKIILDENIMDIDLNDKSNFLDSSETYKALRDKYNSIIDINDVHNFYKELVSNRPNYEPIIKDMSYDPLDCPDEVPEGYPFAWNVKDVLQNWPPDDPDALRNRGDSYIYQGICVFNYGVDSLTKILQYRDAEVPYVVRGDVDVLETVQRWSHPYYLKELLGNVPQRTEFSENNHFMYWKNTNQHEKDWKPPTEFIQMGFKDWVDKATVDESKISTDSPHWYYRISSAPAKISSKFRETSKRPTNHFLYDELTFFRPTPNLYMVDPEDERGMNCRFGMKGVIAENHFDASRNSIALLFGQRRYMLAAPTECKHLELYPIGHPSGRHSAVDWSDPDYDKFPNFGKARVNEIVLQAGDVLYLPKNWFHYIISIDRNYQCNIRSGSRVTREHHSRIEAPIQSCMK